MYAVIRKYQFAPSDGEEVDRKVREVFVPLVKKAPGFVAYYQRLNRELQRKDRALAEAAALLVLQKKVRAIWEESEDAPPPKHGAWR